MLQDALARFLKIPGVLAIMVVAKDGSVIQSISSSTLDLPYLGMILADVIKATNTIVSQIGEKEVPMLLFEFENGSLLVFPLNAEVSSVVVTRSGANTGQIRYEMKISKDLLVNSL
jgi:predicted regulator of Ras-like GTPase activity (Roadblock/LC7/MglB family)